MITKQIFPSYIQIKQTIICSILFSLSLCFQLENAVAAPPAPGKAEDIIDKAYSECIEKSGGVTVDMRNCMSEASEKWDVDLNEVYQKLMKTLNQDGKKHLKAAQEAWLKFRDAEFAFIDSLPEPGTAALLLRDESRLGVIKDRVLQLRKRFFEEQDNPS